MTTLRELRDRKCTISLYCHQTMPVCHGAWHPSIDQLIQYCGVDFDIYARRTEFLGMFKCEGCGRSYSTLSVAPYPSGGYNAFYAPSGTETAPASHRLSEADLAQLARDAEWRQAEIDRNKRDAARFRDQAKMEARAAKGVFDIGPPDPRKHWLTRPRMRR